MMGVSSVDVLIQYYDLFAKRKAEGKHKLKVATIFSYTSNEEDKDADGKEPLPDPDIMELINHPLKLTDRATTRKRVLGKVVDFVSTFILGIAA